MFYWLNLAAEKKSIQNIMKIITRLENTNVYNNYNRYNVRFCHQMRYCFDPIGVHVLLQEITFYEKYTFSYIKFMINTRENYVKILVLIPNWQT